HELLAPISRQKIGCSNAFAEPLRGTEQHTIADLVTVLVVDPLKIVEVEHAQNERLAVLTMGLDPVVECAIETSAVCDTCQWIDCCFLFGVRKIDLKNLDASRQSCVIEFVLLLLLVNRTIEFTHFLIDTVLQFPDIFNFRETV